MLSTERKHHHRRVNKKRLWWIDRRKLSSSWPAPHIGKWWKRKLHKARRRWYKERLHGRRGKEPTAYESEVNWKTW